MSAQTSEPVLVGWHLRHHPPAPYRTFRMKFEAESQVITTGASVDVVYSIGGGGAPLPVDYGSSRLLDMPQFVSDRRALDGMSPRVEGR